MAIEKIINIKVNDKDITKLNKNLDVTQKEVKETSKATNEMGNSLDKATGGVISKFKGIGASIKGVVTGFKSLRVAIIATGIGILLIAIVSLQQAFTRSEEGQNKWAKALFVVGNVVDEFLDLLADLGEFLISVFENPQQAIRNFAKLIQENIINRFNGILEVIPKLGTAISLLFEGKFGEASKVATDAVGKIVTGLDSVTDSTQNAINKTQEFIEKLQEEADIAGQIADNRANADKIERGLLVERANANRKIAELREKAEQRDLFSAKERTEFLQEASDISEKINNKEQDAIRLRLKSQVAENALGKSNKEALDEEARLQAQLIDKETERLNLQKRLTTQIQSFTRESNAEAKAKAAETQKREDEKRLADEKILLDEIANEKKRQLKDEEDRLASLQRIEDLENEFFNSKLSKEQQEENAVREKYFKLIEQAKQFGEDSSILEEAQRTALQEIQDKFDLQSLEKQKKKKEQDIQIEEDLQNAKREILMAAINTAINGFVLLGQLAGKNKALQAAALVGESLAGIARIVVNTQAANSAVALKYALIPGGVALAAAETTLNKINAGIGIAANLIATKKALGSLGGGGGVSASPVRDGGGGQSAPAFNVVGNSDASRLGQTINERRPIRAFVVGNDVTTQQEMDRNTRRTATIG